jgi:hypothetical protein
MRPTNQGLPPGYQRSTYIIKEEYVDKIKGIAYFEQRTIREVIEEALEQYFADQPDSIKRKIYRE